MVGISAILRHIPKIRFRKGGLLRPGGPAPAATAPAAAAPASASAAHPAAAAMQAAPMSAGAPLPDINLPAKYMRQPPTQEEIDHINGGGVA